ncbi:hypothetical protein PR202_gb12838 [Eleusine coracana subsp. coracana]|uniref:Uncharacterized protein n=1 Tax=Eleusine coracana subsp. coracana TaxID=191504 RepID=A0AAV5ERB1_ELECO|nr:hypothetical protein PR202_gb12838 [Eleusine coracana subsp. coracana]
MLRRNRGLVEVESTSPSAPPPAPASAADPEDVLPSAATSDGDHINLFSGGGRAGRSRGRTSRRTSSADRSWARIVCAL